MDKLNHPIITEERFMKEYSSSMLKLVALALNLEYVSVINVLLTSINRPDERTIQITIEKQWMEGPNETVVSFTLSQIRGNASILISSDLKVEEKYQDRGVAKALQQFKDLFCLSENYSVMLCTTNTDNVVQDHILSTNGWGLAKRFYNLRTGKSNQLWIKDSFG